MSDGARLEELLVQRTVEKLTAAESAELETLVSLDSLRDAVALERAAAAICLAVMLPDLEPLPARLRERIEVEASRRLRGSPDPG
jgi:hypothetical protein